MRRIIFIMTMLVMTMGVSLSSNAQGESLPYSMDWTDINDGWAMTYIGSPTPSQISTFSIFQLGTNSNGSVTMQKYFDLDNMDSIDIYFNYTEETTTGYDIELSIYIDGILTSVDTTVNSITDMVTITNSTSFNSNSYIEVVMNYISQTGTTALFKMKLADFEVIGYENTGGGVGVSENDLSNKLEVYSYNKSVFIASNDNMNANVSVYNMSGQLVSSEVMNLSNSKSELNLSDMNTGMYIVNITDGSSVMQKKVYIQ